MLERRRHLRADRLAARAIFAKSEAFAAAGVALNRHLIDLMGALEPQLLGSYWPVRGEFDLSALINHVAASDGARLALPYAQAAASPDGQSVAPAMEFHAWDGKAPTVKDGCGIASSDGARVQPDVVIVPCVGFTASGYRLGYGGGYFDRWLALHPHATAVGVAWSGLSIDEAEFEAQAHDIPLALVVTEKGVVEA